MNVRELARALSEAPDQDAPVAFVLGPYAGEDGRRTSEPIAVPANVAYYDDPGRGPVVAVECAPVNAAEA